MDKVIGIGSAGCAIAEEFTEHPEYRVYKIAPGLDSRADLSIPECKNMQEYEERLDKSAVATYLRGIDSDSEVLVILQGGDPVAGIILSVLEEVKTSAISLLYIIPETGLLAMEQERDHKITLGVLQQYARSGLFTMMYLVDRPRVEEILGDIPIDRYEKSVNNFISYMAVMINYFNHTDPIISTKIDPAAISRIATFSIGSLEPDAAPQYLSSLPSKQEEHFYYGIPEAQISEDTTLMRKIKEQVRNLSADEFSTTFSVYSTTFDSPMIISLSYSKDVRTPQP